MLRNSEFIPHQISNLVVMVDSNAFFKSSFAVSMFGKIILNWASTAYPGMFKQSLT